VTCVKTQSRFRLEKLRKHKKLQSGLDVISKLVVVVYDDDNDNEEIQPRDGNDMLFGR
jgi:hypothetical protein